MLSGLRNEKRPAYTRTAFWADLRAGIILLASYVPSAMALGVISGMGPLSALWCGVLVGIIAALSGGTRALVSGPSAVLAVIMASLVIGSELSLPELAVIIVMAGVFQMALGARRDRPVRFLHAAYRTHGVHVRHWRAASLVASRQAGSSRDERHRRRRRLPGRVVRLAGPASANICRRHSPPSPSAGSWSQFLPDVRQLGPVPVGLPVPVLEMPSLDFLPTAVGPAALIALISSIYTLMWALIADSFTGSQHNPNRELFGLGVGNIAAGIVGVLPGGGNIATMTSRRFGGKTVVVGIVCQIIVAALILGLGPYVAPLPLAALLAIVIVVGWNLIDFSFLRKVPRMDPRHSAVMLLILGVTVFVDPLFAIVFGVIATYIVNAAQLEALEIDRVISTPLLDSTFGVESGVFEARVGLLAFRGAFTVSSSRKLIRPICDDIRDHEIVIFDLSEVTHMDDSAGAFACAPCWTARNRPAPRSSSSEPRTASAEPCMRSMSSTGFPTVGCSRRKRKPGTWPGRCWVDRSIRFPRTPGTASSAQLNRQSLDLECIALI